MKLSWTSLKISIAGARLSHLVQKDKIWDHGSMTEQVKTIFFKLQRAKNAGQIEDLKKYLTALCFEKLKKEMDELDEKNKTWVIKNPMIKEVAITEVHEAKGIKPDCFMALIKAMGIQFIIDKNDSTKAVNYSDHIRDFAERWSFVRNGEWWLLDEIK